MKCSRVLISTFNRRIGGGPDSAGSLPGPKAYRRGGPLAVTDANLFLGRIQAAHFPAVFGPGADQPLDADAVAAAFAALAERVNRELRTTTAIITHMTTSLRKTRLMIAILGSRRTSWFALVGHGAIRLLLIRVLRRTLADTFYHLGVLALVASLTRRSAAFPAR